jgi:hypothetical protein
MMRPSLRLLPVLGCALGAAIVGTSCSKFLEPQPTDVLTPDNFYKSGADAVSAVNAVYAQMPYTYLYFFYLGDISGDDIMADAGFGSDGHQLADYTFDKTLWTIDYVWSNEYITINRANIVLDRVPGIQMDPTLKARVLGEAKFLRALSYFTLVSMFGDVPLVTTEITNAKLGVVPRTPKAQIYALIESDLQSASASLPATEADAGRATSGAALALLGKVYLYLGDWNNAAKYEGQVISAGNYHLNAHYYDNFKVATQNTNPENVFSVDYGSPETVTGYIGQVALLFGLPNGFPGGDAYSLELVLPSLVNSYSPTDTRGRGATFITSPDTVVSAFDTTVIVKWNSPPGAALHKPLDQSDHQNMTARSWEQQPNYQPIIRYSDVLLMYAEAVAQGGTATAGSAASALDQVRHRADTALTTSTGSLSGAAFIDTVRVERRKEFVYEGIRWFDLARWGILDQALRAKQAEILTIYPGEFGAVHGVPSSLYPIPQTEINSDPLLTQNAGWH